MMAYEYPAEVVLARAAARREKDDQREWRAGWDAYHAEH